MQTKVQMWGNSLALRIPKSFAVEAGIESNMAVDISLEDGKLIIVPIVTLAHTLEHLLAGITDDNLHKEISTGPAVGQEAW